MGEREANLALIGYGGAAVEICAGAFALGLAEDLTRSVGVAERLLATMASAVLAWWLTGVSLTQLDTPGLDALVAVLPLSVAFTAFAVGGVANAVNIIDGFHGLDRVFLI